MRLKITLKSDKPHTFTKDYNEALTALIYRLITDGDKTFGEELHDNGYRQLGSKHFNFFTYSRLMSEKMEWIDKYIPSGNIIWYFTSISDDIVINFMRGLQKRDTLQIYDFNPCDVRLVCLHSGFLILYKHLITIKKLHLQFHLFWHSIEQRIILLDKVCLKLACHHFRLQEYRQIVVPSHRHGYWRQRGEYCATCKIRPFFDYRHFSNNMTGSPELVRIAYECGLGSKNSQGFGMLAAV